MRTSAAACPRDGIAVTDLNLDTALGGELRHDYRISNLLENSWFRFASQTIVEGVKIRSGNYKFKVNRLYCYISH